MISNKEKVKIEFIFDGEDIDSNIREYLYRQINEFDSQYLKLKASGYDKNTKKTRDHIKRIETLTKHILEAQRIGMIGQDIRIEPPLIKQDNINRLYAGLKKFLDDKSIEAIIRHITPYENIVFYKGNSFEYLTPYAGFINREDYK